MEFITWLLLALLLMLTILLFRKRCTEELVNLPPGNMGLPIFGNSLEFVMKKVAFFSENHRKHGRVFKSRLFGRNVVRVYGAENIKKIIQGEHKIVQSSYPPSVKKLVGESSLAMSKGDIHKEKKLRLLKYLSPDFFHNHTPIFSSTISQRIGSWCSVDEIDLFEECHELFLELATRYLINIDVTDDCVKEIIKNIDIFNNNIFSLPFNIPGFGFHKALKAKQRIREIIAAAVHHSVNNNDASDELSSVLQGLGSDCPDSSIEKNDELFDNIMELLFAGSTTITAASFILARQLCKRPDVVEKIRREINALNLLNADETLCANDLQQMKYVNAVVKESLRLAPPVGGAYRTATESFELDGYTVPKDWSVVFSIRETHKNDNSISNNDDFIPERWLSSDIPNKYSYLPFGGGLRACPGQAYAKMVLKLFAVEFARTCSSSISKDSELSFWPIPHPVKPLMAAVKRLQ